MASPIEDQGAQQLRAVTPADGGQLPLGPCRALWVGGAGNLSVIAVGDTAAVTITGVLAGSVVPIRAKHVQAATTATAIVALYQAMLSRFGLGSSGLTGGGAAPNPELVVNGTFDSDLTGWTDASSAPSTMSWSDGQALSSTDGAANARLRQSIASFIIGRTYRLTRTGNMNLSVGTTAGGVDILAAATTADRTFVATATVLWLNFVDAINGRTADNVSVRLG